MNKLFACLSVSLVVGICACTQVEETKSFQNENVPPQACSFSDTTPTEVNGALDVYVGVARAVKYNTLKLSDTMRQKIYTDNPNASPYDVIEKVLNAPDNGNAIYNGVRALDYAIMYASAYLAETPYAASDMIMQKSAQSLAVAAIKTHGDILSAEKVIRQINDLIQSEKKNLAALNAKYTRQGKLSDAEIDYKSTLEAALVQLPEIRENLVNEVIEYRQLVKTKKDKLRLDGRKFYELDVFDKNLTPEVYQRAALKSRPEFQSPEAKIRDYDFVAISRYIKYNYDADDSLDINGFEQNRQVYVEALEKQAAKAAKGLISAIVDYRRNQNPEDAFRLKEEIYDEMAAAIFVQIELMYRVVQVTTLDYDKTNRAIAALRKEIRLSDGHSLDLEQRGALLEKKITLIRYEVLLGRIKSERSTAIASLYFYAGYEPFICSLLSSSPQKIASTLKTGFTSDRIAILTKALEEARRNADNQSLNSGGDAAYAKNRHHEKWAEGDNWLEEVVEGKNLSNDEKRWLADETTLTQKTSQSSDTQNLLAYDADNPRYSDIVISPRAQKSSKTVLRKKDSMEKILSHPKGKFEPYVGEEPNRRKVLQLGAYIYPQNYDIDWKRLSTKYPRLKSYKPLKERAEVNGQMFNRLFIYSSEGNLRDLCNYLRQNHEECFLR